MRGTQGRMVQRWWLAGSRLGEGAEGRGCGLAGPGRTGGGWAGLIDGSGLAWTDAGGPPRSGSVVYIPLQCLRRLPRCPSDPRPTLPMLACMSPSAVPAPPSLKRPRGLWKQRKAEAAHEHLPFLWPNQAILSHARLPSPAAPPAKEPSLLALHLRSPSASSSRRSLPRSASPGDDSGDDSEDDYDDARSSSSASSTKRRRLSGHFESSPEDLSHSSSSPTPRSAAHSSLSPLDPSAPRKSDAAVASPRPSPPLVAMPADPISRSVSTASNFSLSSSRPKSCHSAGYEDWENLKELFARAAERYDGASLFRSIFLPLHPRSAPGPDRPRSRSSRRHPRGSPSPSRRHSRMPPLPHRPPRPLCRLRRPHPLPPGQIRRRPRPCRRPTRLDPRRRFVRVAEPQAALGL